MQIAPSSTSDALPETWIERLLDRMLLSYGKRFLDQWAGVDTNKLIAHWSRELATFSRDELGRGYAALETRDWPPTLPEFKKLCRPGIDPTAAYHEAVAGFQAREGGALGSWSHPAVYWAAVKIGAFDLKNQGYSQIRARWETVLDAEMAKGAWTAVPQPMAALPAPGKSLTSREMATKALAQLGATGILRRKADPRAWAQRVLERDQQGDQQLPQIAVRFAKEALKEPVGA